MENCIDQKHRLRTSAELGFMREHALKALGRYCVFNVYRQEEGENKFAIITSRRFHKHAVKRNRARRLLKEAYRRLFPNLASATWIVLLPRRYILKAKMDEVFEEMKKLAQELNIYCAENE